MDFVSRLVVRKGIGNGQWQIQGGAPGARPPPSTDENLLNFMQFFDKSGKFVCWCPPPGRLAPPTPGNPGSAPDGSFSLHLLSNGRVAIQFYPELEG